MTTESAESRTPTDRVVLAVMQKTANMTRTEVAKKLGISRPMWTYLETGRRNPGSAFYKGAIAAFPELTNLCISVITTDLLTPNL